MFLKPPYPIISHQAEDREPKSSHGVELDPCKSEGPVAKQQDSLPRRIWKCDACADRLAGPGTETAVRSRIHPASRLVRVDHLPGIGDEVPPVPNHDCVSFENVLELLVDPHGVKRGTVVVQLW